MIIPKRLGQLRLLPLAALVLITLSALLFYSHFSVASKVNIISHSDVISKIVAEIDPNEHDPLGYLKKEVESEYINQLMVSIKNNHELLEDLEYEYARKNSKLILDHITGTIVEGLPIPQSLRETTEKIELILATKYSKRNYYDDILENVIVKNAPTCGKLQNRDSIFGYNFNSVWNPCFSKKWLTEKRVKVSEEAFHDLQSKHDSLVKTLRELPDPPHPFVKGDGIVINGGGGYLIGALTVIGQLRELGSKLPVELVMTYLSEYDEFICETLLPRYNTKCLVVETEIGAPLLKKLDLQRFQLKMLGLLVTSFDNIIALDADNFPLKNPDKLLETEVFKKTKFVLWPDLWHKGTSPIYYDIARFEPGEPVKRSGIPNDWSYTDYISNNRDTDVMFHDLDGIPSPIGAETGQMVFSKKLHYKSFLLSVYYNIYGYSHYYPLMYQGVFGSGDRETFVPALHVMNEPFHMVERETWLAGFVNNEGRFLETTLVQHDPQQSADFLLDWKVWLRKNGLDTRLSPHQKNDYTRDLLAKFTKDMSVDKDPYQFPDVMFLHIHRPKINAVDNAKPHGDSYDDLFSRRNLGKPGRYPEFGTRDWELAFHTISKWMTCNAVTSKRFWKDIAEADQETVCQAVTKYVDFLKEDSKDLEAGELKVVNSL